MSVRLTTDLIDRECVVAQVIAKRRDNSTVPAITLAFTDDLAAQLGSQLTKAQQWQAGGISPLKPLVESEA